MSVGIGVDLGTATVLVYIQGRGIVLKQPSVVAIDASTRKVLAVGDEASKMLGKTPGNILAIRPLRSGVIAEYDVTEAMLRHFLQNACSGILKPDIVISVPSGATSVEKRAVVEAAKQAGARKALVLYEPLAAALGAGLDVSAPKGHMVVDIGGGTTEMAVISLGGIVVSRSIRVAGDAFDEAIIQMVKREHNVLIGERSAEEAKINAGSAVHGRTDEFEVRGRDLVTGLPRNVTLSSEAILYAIKPALEEICSGVIDMLETTPPELCADILDSGITLTGGGSLLYGMDALLSEKTGIRVNRFEDPVAAVALGCGRALDFPEIHEGHVAVLRRLA